MKLNRLKRCECGCGQIVNNRFVHNHHFNGVKRPEHSNRMKELYANIDFKKKFSLAMLGHFSPLKNRKITEQHRNKIIVNASKYWLGKKLTIEHKNILSTKQKEHWQSPEYVSKQMLARGVIPNKQELWLEQFLNKLYPNEWKFVGDGQLIINGKCPDFVNINGQKKIIELVGDYWHDKSYEIERPKIFEPFGYKTLIIWSHELKKMNKVEFRINKFMRS